MRKRLIGMLLLVLAVMMLSTGAVQAGFVKSGKSTYYKKEDGTYATGLQEINGKLYYFSSTGALYKSQWITDSNGKKYYASRTGKLFRSRWAKHKMYFNDQGQLSTGLTEIKGKLFYFGLKTGFVQIGKLKDTSTGKLYITNKSGRIYRGCFFKYNGKSYYANSDGSLALGLTQIGNDYYFFHKKNGRMITKATRKVNGKTYYLTKTGAAARSRWVKINKKYYYFLSDGTMATNQFIGSKWYVGADGTRVKRTVDENGVVTVNGKKYLFDDSGNMITGQWVTKGSNTYYCGADGALLTGLQTLDDAKYYFDENGVMLKDTIKVIGSTTYKVGSDGKLTETTGTLGSTIAEYAQQFVGNPYVYGGTSLTNGCDCSGFCYAVYGHFGIQLMRVADDQMNGPNEAYQKLGYKKGTVIKDADLLPGDMIFYVKNGYAHHAALYIGDGKVVHAANSRLGIIISDMDYSGVRAKDHAMRYWA